MEKYVLRYRKKGYTQSQLDAAARCFGADRGLQDISCEPSHDFEELAVFGKTAEGQPAETAMPFAQLERWVKKAAAEQEACNK